MYMNREFADRSIRTRQLQKCDDCDKYKDCPFSGVVGVNCGAFEAKEGKLPEFDNLNPYNLTISEIRLEAFVYGLETATKRHKDRLKVIRELQQKITNEKVRLERLRFERFLKEAQDVLNTDEEKMEVSENESSTEETL